MECFGKTGHFMRISQSLSVAQAPGFKSQLDSSAAQPEAMNATPIYLSKFPNPTATSRNVDHIILPQERGLNFKLLSFIAIKAMTRFEPMPTAN